MGTGSNNGAHQVALGKEGFTRLIHEAYDRGIRYFDCASQYKTFPWMADAFKGLPREELFITSKIWAVPEDPEAEIERHLRNFNSDYIDCMLVHCAVQPDWLEQRKSVIDALVQARGAGRIRALGVSCHSLPALRVASQADFVDVNLVRVNPQCSHTDQEARGDRNGPPQLAPVLAEIRNMKAKGNGVIGMKIIGNGDFKQAADRERSIRFAMAQPDLDAVVIGFRSTTEIDEAIQRMDQALADA